MKLDLGLTLRDGGDVCCLHQTHKVCHG
jgi:hypothetical protein